MQSLNTLTRLIVTVCLCFSLALSSCNARKQLFSGSHSFLEEDDKSHPQESTSTSHSSTHHDPLNREPCGTKNVTEIKGWGIKSCSPVCEKDDDCSVEEGYKCSCDGACGLTCNRDEEKLYCGFPGRIENGRVLIVGKLGLYDYRNQLKTFSHNQKIIFECDEGFALAHGPSGKTCRNGLWLPAADNPECVESEGSAFRWIRSTRKKRRAIKTGGGTFARTKGAGSGGGDRGSGPGRRINRKNKRPGDDDEYSLAPMACPSLDHDEFMQVEVIRNGDDVNNTFSLGAVAKISCTPGFGMNLNNETVTCEKGRWKPKLPQCSALPCKTPYVIHGTFYVGSKPLFFQELKPHDTKVDLRCSKGFAPKGPSKLQCWYGEWAVEDAPECVPAGCRLPLLEKGMYLMNYKPEMVVVSGTEVDYICDDNYQKPYSSGAAKCDYGNFKPTAPKCISNALFMQRNFSLENFIPPYRKPCGSPPNEKLAIAYMEGTPLDFVSSHRFPHGTEIMYRCIIVRPRAKNRWKVTCDDGKWSNTTHNITCETNITTVDYQEAKEITKLVNSSCSYRKNDKHVATFYNDQELRDDQIEFPFLTVLNSRCIDIGKFQLKGARKQKCISGQWMGLTPKCEGLSQYHDYAVDKSPTILFRFVNGSIAQTVEGKLIVYPGTTLHMECLYLRKFGRPSWEVSNTHRTYEEGWTDGIEHRDPTLEYRLTIDNADKNDSGIYSCSTPTRHSHQIHIIVKKVECPPLPERDDLIYSTTSNITGTRVSFQCKYNNSLVGNKEIMCQASGSWNAALPRCENVECPDISMVPAMAPLAYTEITRNGTLKKNETAPPKITIQSRDVGGKVIFTCPQGFVVEGSTDAVCQSNGEWSAAMPLCKEVECPTPPSPENGYVSRTPSPPYKAGDLAQIECNQGFMMEGQPMIACQDSGKWSRASTTTKCVPACTYPGTTIGGTISIVKFYYAIGESVEYDCQQGYSLVGDRILLCGKSAKWTNTIPNCVPDHENSYMGLIADMERSGINSRMTKGLV
ncbi:Locomotion-related protein Hikaru genki [Orchesella cincta]|uniref:Locomotion-related protein Hikaru genki n=1 Tax=Orchesella cincta TaxID=48709 RepID=A0A1D2N9C7_ORCCI|nr:Locomotion-related protein Hikaru genki [Orchesella cincta]